MNSSSTATCIETVARLRSISAAAEALGISQPALSSRIKKVETQLGAQLFDRSRTPLSITDAGRAYLETQQGIEALNRRLAQRISDMLNLASGKLVIGGASLFNSTLLPAALARFSELYPGIEVRVVTDTVPNLTQAALDGAVDLFITPVPNDNLNLESERLLTEKLFLCLPKSSPLTKKLPSMGAQGYASIGTEDFRLLASEPFILLSPTLQLGRKLQQLFGLYGVTPAHSVVVDQTSTGFALSMAGSGVCMIAESAVRDKGRAENAALYLASEEICSRELYIARLKSASRSKAEEEFSRILKEVVGR